MTAAVSGHGDAFLSGTLEPNARSLQPEQPLSRCSEDRHRGVTEDTMRCVRHRGIPAVCSLRIMHLDAPRGFRDAERIAERNALLATAGATAPLEKWARDFEDRRRPRQPDIVIPHFDPAEAGVAARVLLLLEAPGLKTVPEWGGSGFISVDNNDPTAENIWRTRDEAGLHDRFLAWNIVPWVLGRASVKPAPAELAQGALALRSVLDLSPDLRVIVLAGQKAQSGWDTHLDLPVGDRYRVLRTVHPAGQSFAQAGARGKFAAALERAARDGAVG
jgi:hypothetical protein